MRFSLAVLIAATLASGHASAQGFKGMFSFSESSNPDKIEPATRQARPLSGVPSIEKSVAAAVGAGLPGLNELSGVNAPLPNGPIAKMPSETTGPTPQNRSRDSSTCISAIRDAEKRHSLPENILLAIGLQEAGRKVDGVLTVWPWSINVEGDGYTFETRSEAEAFVSTKIAEGVRSIDIGCMQINLRWHPNAFATLNDGFDPYLSADYAARFLKSLHKVSEGWIDAAGQYHSDTPALKAKYLLGIEKNLKVAESMRDDFDALALSSIPQVAALSNDIAPGSIGRTRFNSLASPVRSGYSGSKIWRRSVQSLSGKEIVSLRQIQRAPAQQEAGQASAGPWWTSELSSKATNGSARSIYSNRDLEPVIPDNRAFGSEPDHSPEP